MSRRERQRVLVIGLDGGTLDLVRPWAEAGKLPVLNRLMREGTWGVLESTIHPITAPAWSSFLTGVNPGRHGVYDFVRRCPRNQHLELTSAATIQCPTLFSYLTAHGCRIVSVNVPFTYPPPQVEGVHILAGLPAPVAGPQIAHPRHLFDEVQAAVGRYSVRTPYRSGPDALDRYAREVEASVETHAAAMRYLLDRDPWDVGLLVLSATDEASHAFWHCMEAPDGTPAARYRDVISRVYQRADQAIGELLESASDDVVVFIMSDHGFGPLKKLVHLNRWLADAGFLQLREKGTGWSWQQFYLGLLKRSAELYKQYLPPTLRRVVRTTLDRSLSRARNRLESDLFQAPIDWTHTRAYALGVAGSIYVNLAGREPYGVVSPGAEYEAVCQEIASGLEKLEDPETGTRLVKRVVRREEVYHGPFLDQAPDLIVLWRDYAYWGRGRYDIRDAPLFQSQVSIAFTDLPVTGMHRLEGMLIAYGPGIAAGRTIQRGHIVDLLPTILYALRLPIPQGLDGRVLIELWEAPTAPQMADESPMGEGIATADSVFTADEARAVEKRLRDLGYL